MSDMLAVTAWTICGALITGLLLALLGSLKMALACRPQRATSPVTLLLLLLNVLLVPLLVLGGVLVDYAGLRAVMIGGPVLLALSLLALGSGTNYRRTQVAVVCAALAATSIATASVVLMPRALFGEQALVASLQLGMVFVGLGALVSAPLIDLLLGGLGFRKTMAVFALFALLPAFLAALPDRPELELQHPEGSLTTLLEDPGIWLGCLVFFFYAPLEGFVSVWVTTHLAKVGQPPRQIARVLFAFWMAVIFSRLLVAIVQHAAERDTVPTAFLVVPALLVAVVLGNLSAVTRPERVGPGLVMLGLFMGPIYPLLVGLLFRTPGGFVMPGTSYGVLCACGSLGGLALSPLVGYCARSRNLQVALLIPMFLALILTGAALLFGLRADA